MHILDVFVFIKGWNKEENNSEPRREKRLKKEISERLEKTNNNFSIGIFNFKIFKISFNSIQLI